MTHSGTTETQGPLVMYTQGTGPANTAMKGDFLTVARLSEPFVMGETFEAVIVAPEIDAAAFQTYVKKILGFDITERDAALKELFIDLLPSLGEIAPEDLDAEALDVRLDTFEDLGESWLVVFTEKEYSYVEEVHEQPPHHLSNSAFLTEITEWEENRTTWSPSIEIPINPDKREDYLLDIIRKVNAKPTLVVTFLEKHPHLATNIDPNLSERHNAIIGSFEVVGAEELPITRQSSSSGDPSQPGSFIKRKIAGMISYRPAGLGQVLHTATIRPVAGSFRTASHPAAGKASNHVDQILDNQVVIIDYSSIDTPRP